MKVAIISHDYLFENYNKLVQLTNNSHPDWKLKLLTDSENSHVIKGLQSFAPNMLVSENMAGFDNSTLLDGIAYNLQHCLQIHILYEKCWESPQLLSYIEKPLSLSMHFYCTSEYRRKQLLSANPDIPFLEILPWAKPDIEKVISLIEKNI